MEAGVDLGLGAGDVERLGVGSGIQGLEFRVLTLRSCTSRRI
jgi:hypothetical protein